MLRSLTGVAPGPPVWAALVVGAIATAKGAGGRFIPSEDTGKPIRHGLKALDPHGEANALGLCARAATLSDDALARTRRLREAMSDARTMALLVGVLRDIAAIEDAGQVAAVEAQKKAEVQTRDLDERRRALARKLEAWVKTQEDTGWPEDE